MLVEVAVPLHVRDLWTYVVDAVNLAISSALAIASTVADDSLKLKNAEGCVKVFSTPNCCLRSMDF